MSIETRTVDAVVGGEQAEIAGPELVAALSDPDESVRSEAAEALIDVHYPPAVEGLIAMVLRDPYWVARCSAAEALGSYPGPESVAALVESVLEDEYEPVSAYAAGSLGMHGDVALLPTIEGLMGPIDALGAVVVQVDLRLSAYRLGAGEHLRWILGRLPEFDEHEAGTTLTGIGYLMDAPSPPTLSADYSVIRAALQPIPERFPILTSSVARLLRDLPRV